MRRRRCGCSRGPTISPATIRDVYAAARATGADVPVCLDPRARLMRGIGEKLSAPLKLPPLPAVLVNPGVAVATKDGICRMEAAWPGRAPRSTRQRWRSWQVAKQFLQFLRSQANDLEAPAVALAPVIAEVLAALRALPGCALARMSGSGATCFALIRPPPQRRCGEDDAEQISRLVGAARCALREG